MDDLPPDRIREILVKVQSPEHREYLHWDRLRRRPPPEGLTSQEWWFAVKIARNMSKRWLPLLDCSGKHFYYTQPDAMQEMLPAIDSQARGHIGIGADISSSENRDRYVVSSLIEEAITSSQLEGAATTRKEAVAMLRAGREPRDRSERMILNNYLAMQHIRELRGQPLSVDLICQIHAVITSDTLDNQSAAGHIQTANDKRVKVYDNEGEILHSPPPAEELTQRMQDLCKFANSETKLTGYMHPIIRAIVLHFWLAYDHPFEDGNGRTARALFYWSVLNSGYWLFEYISISSLLREGAIQYGRSFLYTESDEGDMTYFVVHQLKIILRAIGELEKFIERKRSEMLRVGKFLRNMDTINHRQRALLGNALKHPGAQYSIESHKNSHAVAYATARADLLQLSEMGLLHQYKAGKAFRYSAPNDLEARLSRLSD